MKSDDRAAVVARMLLAMCLILIVTGPLGPSQANAASALARVATSGSATGGKRITIRVELTEPAPGTGITVALSSSSPLIPVPSSIRIAGGETEKTIGVTTVPTAADQHVTVTARLGGVVKSREILIKEPVLSSLSVQSKIRAGGRGKVTVRLSGGAPAGGLTLNVKSNRPSIVPLPGSVRVDGGSASAVLVVDAAMVSNDVQVNVIARYDGVQLVRSTVVRNYLTVTPTAPATQTPTETATATETMIATDTPVPPATVTPAPTETATAEPSASATPAPTDTATPTPAPEPEPPQFTFVFADNPIFVGQQSSADMCWSNAQPGAEAVTLYLISSRTAGSLTGSPHLNIVGVRTGDFLAVTVTATAPCIRVPLAGASPGTAFLVAEIEGQGELQSSGGVMIKEAVATVSAAPMGREATAEGLMPIQVQKPQHT